MALLPRILGFGLVLIATAVGDAAAADLRITPIRLGSDYLLVSAPDSRAPAAELRQRLQARITCAFDEISLGELAKWLAQQTGVTLVVAPAITDRVIDLRLREVALSSCLAWIERLAGVSASYIHGGIYLAAEPVAGGQRQVLYNVASLTIPRRDFPGPQLGYAAAPAGGAGLWAAPPEAAAPALDLEQLAELLEQHLAHR